MSSNLIQNISFTTCEWKFTCPKVSETKVYFNYTWGNPTQDVGMTGIATSILSFQQNLSERSVNLSESFG